ncbi:tuftelin 1b isoform X3 [Acanthochromis polyacanthus]|uniref:Tuftelin-like n=3 Tax=Acanthochromis polyacanthus TaxID=80966 RepID=A0A3Q1FY77_9TELE|nr:tuftelin 1b isoform X3 [Acanthochromis polyacanthus]XP_022075364.1 tuftelin 1b isoform X3 [Acanthochromis polyacanthus]
MNGGVLRTVDDGEVDETTNERCRRLRLALQGQDQAGYNAERHNSKESSIAVVLPQKPEEKETTPELITPTDEKVEVIKVYLESRPETAESVRMLTDEVSQIQEVRYCLKTLREQMAARQSNNNNKYPVNGFKVTIPINQPAVTNGNGFLIDTDSNVEDNQEESARLREATRRLYLQLTEMEKRHQEERESLQSESDEYRLRLAEQSERLQRAEEQSDERGQQVEELQRLLGNMEIESGALKKKLAAGEAELLQLQEEREDEEESEQRCLELEKEVAVLKEKIHHLDDMLKSQQRKVRHMIEQLQNSRTVLQERDRVIRDLEERVAFLEAENREMHDHMEYFLAGQEPPPLSTENKPEVVYSKTLMPTTQTNKALPFIKVIEIKS